MGNRAEKAVAFFKQGYNCSQSVVMAFADKYDMSLELAAKLSVAFGGGMGRMREVCGTVSGMLIVIGLEKGTLDPSCRELTYRKTQEIIEIFKEQFGTIYCKELLKIGDNSALSFVPEKRTPQYYKKRPCVELVRFAVELLEQKIGNRSHPF